MYLYLTIFLIFIIVILCYYYGYYRFFILHYVDEMEYITNYRNISHHQMNTKVIVSVTTTPERIKYLKPMLKSILNQSVRIDEIALNIPSKYDIEIPDTIQHMSNIYRTGRDYGKATKCLPTIFREGDMNTIIIMLDDDYIYGYDFIKSILNLSAKYPNKALIGKGVFLIKPFFIKEDIIDITKDKIDDESLLRYLKVDKIKINVHEYNNYKNIFL